MKTNTILRLAALGVLGAALLYRAAGLSAAEPTGDNPANGIPEASASAETCAAQTLAPGAQIWLKVPYHAGTDLQMRAKNAAGLTFDVYDPTQVANWPSLPAQPIGRLTPNSNEPGYTDTWQGHLAEGLVSDYYYVLVTNTNTSPVTFSFCTIETQKFTPPPQGVPSSPALGQCIETATIVNDSTTTYSTFVDNTCSS